MSETQIARPRVLSGMQPSGELHIGNYIGALKHWVDNQVNFENFFCVVDLHSLTVPYDPIALRKRTRDLIRLYLAAGIDPNQSVLFIQSHIPAHSELAWILGCHTPMGWLGRMTQFKEKSGERRDSVGSGLFFYPVLMAADILLYDAKFVPVGEDQKQHIEICRDIAQVINSKFGPVLQLPEPMIPKAGARIMSLVDPTKKMSKSDENSSAYISLLDPPKTIEKKFARATTDSLTEIRFDEERPGILNLLTLYQVLAGLSSEQIEAHFSGKMYGHLKKEVATLVVDSLAPLQDRYRQLQANPDFVEQVIRSGAERAAEVAEATMRRVKIAAGIG